MPSDGQHLLLIAIGPVQPFIAAARKIRDLRAGSQMLSALSAAVVTALKDGGCTMVFPVPDDTPSARPYGLANKILALTPKDRDPRALAAAAQQAVTKLRASWFTALQTAMTHAGLAATIAWDRVQPQSGDYGEFYAVWTPCRAESAADARPRVEQLLAARKATRDFAPPGWDGAGVPKNSLDGGRESVLRDVSATSPLTKAYAIKQNEHLDALGLLKRWQGRALSEKFETLTSLALAPWLAGLDAEQQKLLDKALAALKSLGPQPDETHSLLYLNRLAAWLKEHPNVEHGQASDARAAVRDLDLPPGYACVLRGDGDGVGEASIAFKELNLLQTFAQTLESFPTHASEIVQNHGGSLIYGGGDDVLAFLPLHRALDCAVALRAKFNKLLEPIFEKLPAIKAPTFSVGLAIVHHLEPLYSSLATARRAEDRAKAVPGKDALAVIQCLRGTGEREIAGQWDNHDPDAGFSTRLNQLIAKLRRKELPARLAHQLLGLGRTLRTTTGEIRRLRANDSKDPWRQVMECEVRRILQAKPDLRTTLPTDRREALEKLLWAAGGPLEFANELLVARQFAEAQDVARCPLPT